ncbi:histidine--tRNA ligase [Mycetocola reblochoni]|uniref:Histidine--tRNA ligase n=2 Tax=Mycetocola reblochoni TaxID=331618 RepID=A0A1R4I6Q6_9MICO|nr:histidine--tRNA ligase [Mycetocola reblochoni]RLP68206.1 histidine--tRNA ligase [Mycetocola reblochoni]SJN15366.1 Histidyl-tRNA synthetase [Mycetocola reblochoni REB411]
MAAPVTPPRGMRDFLPADKARRERILGTIRRVYSAHGFDEIETPVVEDHARLHSGLGGDNEKMSFSVLRRGLGHDDLVAAAEADDAETLADLGLRFDLTVPLARYYASHRAELPPVFRSVQIGPVWRAERPQKGRYRQFVQCDIDIIGEAGPLAEVELIQATTAALAALRLDGVRVRINDRRILTAMLAFFGVPEEQSPAVLITLDKLDKVGVDGVAAELADRGIDAEVVAGIERYLRAARPAAEEGFSEATIRRSLPEGLDDPSIAELAALGAALDGEKLVFDPFLVRGMGYYTGTIFEIEHPDFGYALGGGGRYDGMIGRFINQDVPACGFSIGFERIVDLVDGSQAERPRRIVLVHDRDAAPAVLAAAKAEFVAAGDEVRLERRVKNTRSLLNRVEAEGFDGFAQLAADGTVGEVREFTAATD